MLAAHPGALAEAMEGFGVAEAAARAEVPVLELRAVSNAVGPVTGTPGASATRWRRSRRRSERRHPYWKVGTGMTTDTAASRGPAGNAIEIAFSPCPNDTFVFDAWAHGRVPGAPALDVTFADIDITNGMAERGELDVLKVSYAVLPWVLDDYALLPCGGALGRGCGPLVLTKELGLDLTGRTVAVPSERSTAYLLFRLWAAEMVPGGVGEVVVMPFDEIMPAVRDGKVDAGLVIHEARFTYRNFGLHNLADMVSTGRTPRASRSPSARSSRSARSARRPCAAWPTRSAARSGWPGTTRRSPGRTSWSTPRRWTRPSRTSTSGCT